MTHRQSVWIRPSARYVSFALEAYSRSPSSQEGESRPNEILQLLGSIGGLVFFTIWGVQMAMDDWAAASGALRGALRLQAWLLHRAGPSGVAVDQGIDVKLEPGI